jgi:hypothetical protein
MTIKQMKMKNLKLMTAVILGLLLFANAKAQNKPVDFFPGRWMVSVPGTPRGDVKMIFVLQRTQAEITGSVQDSTGKEMTKINSITEKDNSITVYFNVHDIDLMLLMEKTDNDHIEGSLLGLFAASGYRMKETDTWKKIIPNLTPWH